MIPGKAFSDVLDEALTGYVSDEPARPARAGFGYATRSILFFDAGLSAAPQRPPTFPSNSSWLPSVTPWSHDGAAPGPSSPARRALSPEERRALEAFVQLGADIDDTFTPAELRSIFRLLALRYHPDRHPGSSDGERARLSKSFAQLHQAYETLKSAPVSSN